MRILTSILLFAAMQSVFSSELPAGWRTYTDEELAREKLRQSYAASAVMVEADFNGDGIADRAYLVKSTRHAGDGLLVELSVSDHHEWIVLDENTAENAYLGIVVATPETYSTLCGKRPGRCEADEPASITLTMPGIRYFTFEGAASLIYWNRGKSSFDRVWISD